MKKLLIITVILAFIAMSASAQISKPFSVYAGGGLSLPMGPQGIKDTYKTGFQGYGGIGFNVAPKFQLVGTVSFNNFAFDWDQLETMLSTSFSGMSGGNLNVVTFGVDGNLNLGAPAVPFSPYVLGGVGFASLSVSDITGGTSTYSFPSSSTDFYFQFGAGLNFKAGPALNMFVQARYVNVATAGDALTYMPVTLGIKF